MLIINSYLLVFEGSGFRPLQGPKHGQRAQRAVAQGHEQEAARGIVRMQERLDEGRPGAALLVAGACERGAYVRGDAACAISGGGGRGEECGISGFWRWPGGA